MPVEPVFKSDDEFLPLQAADMLAWTFRRYAMAGPTFEDPDDRHFLWLAKEELEKVEMSAWSQSLTKQRMQEVVSDARDAYEAMRQAGSALMAQVLADAQEKETDDE